jgi:hypothetical protein
MWFLKLCAHKIRRLSSVKTATVELNALATFLSPSLRLDGYDKTWFIRLNQGGTQDLSETQARQQISQMVAQSILSRPANDQSREMILMAMEDPDFASQLNPMIACDLSSRTVSFSAFGELFDRLPLPSTLQVLPADKKRAVTPTTDQQQGRWTPENERDKQKRMSVGKPVEKAIAKTLKERFGLKIEPVPDTAAGKNQDTRGIDAYWDVKGDGNKVPVQLKWRNPWDKSGKPAVGKDFVIVVYRDWYEQIEGTDFAFDLAKYCALLPIDGSKIHMARMDDIKAVIQQGLKKMQDPSLVNSMLQGQTLRLPMPQPGQYTEMKLKYIERDGKTKLFAYLPPEGLNLVASYDLGNQPIPLDQLVQPPTHQAPPKRRNAWGNNWLARLIKTSDLTILKACDSIPS